jgi:nucleoside-diphosphate-sugar epimerase
MRHLVVGANSRIGQSLMVELARIGEEAVGTTRRPESALPKLDLLNVGEVPKCDVAYICASAIHESPLQNEANVAGTLKVIRRLLDDGAFPVFLSSTAVEMRSDGYARTKAAVEDAVKGLNVGVVRLGNVRKFGLCAHALVRIGMEKRAGLTALGGFDD